MDHCHFSRRDLLRMTAFLYPLIAAQGSQGIAQAIATASPTDTHAKPTISLAPVDEVKIRIVMDNAIDLLMTSNDVAKRYPLGENPFEHPLPVAEHGFSVLISAKQGNKQRSILFDTGVSQKGLLYNMDAMEVNAAEIQAIVLSHGHPDHAMGLPGLVDRLGQRHLPLVLHPDAYLDRKLVLPNGFQVQLPAPKKADFGRENIEIIEEIGPSMLFDNMILISGEVDRQTEFEKGFPIHHARRNATWTADPLIMDDQCAIINVAGKGLVIVTGCGHGGIINIIRHAQALTNVKDVYAIIGGFHLSGGLFEPIIPPTIKALKQINPSYVIPCHCTGWSATHQIAHAMPDAFIPSSVGTTFVL